MTRTILPANYERLTARDLWQDGVGWIWDRIIPFVTEDIRLELMSVVLDTFTGAEDRLSWIGNPAGEFTVGSAYTLLTKNDAPRQNMECFFKRVWGLTVPERVRFFIWLVGNQCVMTNAERKRRHLCDSDICTVCKGGVESLIHILRGCPAMKGIWLKIGPRRRQQAFFDTSILTWLFENLGENNMIEGSPWSTLFAMTSWWGWKWRCGNVFGENRPCRDRVRFVKDVAKEVSWSIEKCKVQGVKPARVERMIGWNPPTSDWFKLNTDGASRGNPGLATAGGVLRNQHGEWCGGFGLNIGRCTAPLAELWGVYYGLYIAWDKKIPRLEVEVDSELVVGFLTTGIGDAHPLSFLVRLCHGLLAKDWSVRISHVYREANRLANRLANYAFTLPLGFHGFSLVPHSVDSLLQDDVIGSSRPRNVCIA
uniref:Putative ribonuclease H protein n=1 Tax=Noccaea caerulescens TaxID=107243 RepID=A0A1J3JIW1_NOCCA